MNKLPRYQVPFVEEGMNTQEERNRVDRDLVQSRKLEAIGRLASGITHEINTPTQYIGDNTRFLKDAFEGIDAVLACVSRLLKAAGDGHVDARLLGELEQASRDADLAFLSEQVPKAIEQSLDGVKRVATIVRAMKEFAHPGGTEKQATDLNHAIANTLTISRNEWKYVADLVTDLDPGLPPVKCVPGEINQAILNLVVNAAQAIAKAVDQGLQNHGTITVRTRCEPEWARIDIEDTGIGIPEEIRERIFEPFFTTKKVGEGSGQGLPITHAAIVKRHGGSISLHSEVGRGTVFTLRLPLE